MKRHYTRTLNDYKCVSCRQEFTMREHLAKHYLPSGKCLRAAVEMTVSSNIAPSSWTKAA